MIVRAERKDGYTVMSNAGLRDERLSYKARGVLAYLLSMPDHWTVSDRQLASAGPDGRHAVQSALRELEKTGYLRRERWRSKNGTFEWASVVYDEPHAAENQRVIDEAAELDQASELPETSTMAGKPNHGEPCDGEIGRDDVLKTCTMAGKPNHGDVSETCTMARLSGHGLSSHGKPRQLVSTIRVTTEQQDDLVNQSEITTTTTTRDEPQNSGGGGGFDSVLDFWRGAGFGEMRPGVEAGLRELEERHGADEVIAALRIADEASSESENKRTLRYIRGILQKRARDRAREEMLEEAHTAGVYGLPRQPVPEPEPQAIRLLREIAQLRESPMELDGDVVCIAVRAPEVAERQYSRAIERTLGSAGLLDEVSWIFTDLKTGGASHGEMPGVRESDGQAEEHLRDSGQPHSAVANGVR